MMRSSGRHDEGICQWQISTSHRCSAPRRWAARLRSSGPEGCNGEPGGRVVPHESLYQGADGKDHRQWLRRSQGDGGGEDGGGALAPSGRQNEATSMRLQLTVMLYALLG